MTFNKTCLNPHSPTDQYLQFFKDIIPALRDFQLQMCALPFVKPSMCGLLG